MILIIVLVLAYLIVGGLLAGFVLNAWSDDVEDYVLVVSLWPLIILFFVVAAIAIGPIKLGQFIKERFEK